MNVRKLDSVLYCVLLFMAFSSCISIAGVSMALGLAVVLTFLRLYQEPVTIQIDKGLLRAMGVFFLAMLLSVVFAYDRWQGLNALLIHAVHTLPFFFAALWIRDSRRLTVIASVITLSMVIADGCAIWQGLHGDWRAQAFASHPMILAGSLIQLIPLTLVFSWEASSAARCVKAFYVAAFSLSMLTLLFNGTRGAWLSIGSFVVLFALWQGRTNFRRFAYIVVALLLFSVGAAQVPSVHARLLTITDMNYESNSERLLIWHSAWRMFLDHPVLGVGTGNFTGLYQHHYISSAAQAPGLGHAHNNFLQMLAETGVIGLAAFVYMFGYIIVWAYRKSSADRQNPWPTVVLFVTICLLVQGFTEYNFGDAAVIHLYWFILGLSCASWRISQEEQLSRVI